MEISTISGGTIQVPDFAVTVKDENDEGENYYFEGKFHGQGNAERRFYAVCDNLLGEYRRGDRFGETVISLIKAPATRLLVVTIEGF